MQRGPAIGYGVKGGQAGFQDGGRGGLTGQVPRGNEAKVSAWWRRGCLGRFRGKELGAAPPEAALRHHAGVGVEKALRI